MTLHWYRRDLRASDNLGLAAAADAADAEDSVASVFVFDDAVLEHAAAPRVRFMLDALADVRAWYRDRDSDLVVARGDPAEVLPALAAARGDDAVFWNEDYSGLSRERDARVRLALEAAGIARETFHDANLHEPGTVMTNAGDPYAVFSYYWRKWRDREVADPVDAPAAADLTPAAALTGDRFEGTAAGAYVFESLPTIEDLGFEEPAADVQAAGTDVARELLEEFCASPIFRYDVDRDYPWKEGTARLSPHLRFGTIGLREVYAATEAAMDRAVRRDNGEGTEAQDSVESFRSQLAWREFYTQVLYYNPDVVTENYKAYEEDIEWRDDEAALEAWKAGETGYPIIDAGMRQLRAEAWMHNRVRLLVASFLTKDLLLDWREGYAHFREHLADHDTAGDNGGWQWAASTGTDAQPYFRIFNPRTQGERYDSKAEYIHEYVPELRDVDANDVHDWPNLSDERREELAPEYPAPIVDHSERRDAAIAMYKRARGENPDE